jgi:AbrB family looped-hinge helix DNA binding protein
MSTTRLSSKGQVIIPKTVRESHHWRSGQALEVVDTPDGVLLRSKAPFAQTTLDEVAGSLPYTGPAITLDEMEEAIAAGVREHHDRG